MTTTQFGQAALRLAVRDWRATLNRQHPATAELDDRLYSDYAKDAL